MIQTGNLKGEDHSMAYTNVGTHVQPWDGDAEWEQYVGGSFVEVSVQVRALSTFVPKSHEADAAIMGS